MHDRVRTVEGESIDDDKWRGIEERLHYMSGDFTDPSLYQRLTATLADLAGRHGVPANYLFYLAVPPDLFGTVAAHLGEAKLTDEHDGWRRMIIEKPFGYDLASARALNATLASSLSESQIYRIDHYLGKETVQNILALRFANGIFEPIWNRRYVDHVQMTVAETSAIETRGAYYDKAGALRDIVQNHMFQLLTLVAMEPPISFRAEDVRDEKVKVLHADPAARGTSIRESACARSTTDTRASRTSRRFAHGNVRRAAAVRRQLAMGRRAVLPAHRQAAADAASPRSRCSSSGRRSRCSAKRRSKPRPERPRHPHPAGRRHLAGVPRQEAGPNRTARQRDDGLQLRQILRRRAGHRL
jgi:hypothetical protein